MSKIPNCEFAETASYSGRSMNYCPRCDEYCDEAVCLAKFVLRHFRCPHCDHLFTYRPLDAHKNDGHAPEGKRG